MQRRLTLFVLFAFSSLAAQMRHAPRPVCRSAVIDGELNAGQPFSANLGSGLKIFFQPIASGWILRVLPVSGPLPEHDYAELATPPYQSVTPLSISTDFAFRAQDAVAWNPRRFRFAASASSFERMAHGYAAVIGHPEIISSDHYGLLSSEIARSPEGSFTILDARLVPGNADQWQGAAAVASHFESTAHTIVQEANGTTSALGRLLWVRFRLKLDVPAVFAVNPALRLEPRVCTAP